MRISDWSSDVCSSDLAPPNCPGGSEILWITSNEISSSSGRASQFGDGQARAAVSQPPAERPGGEPLCRTGVCSTIASFRSRLRGFPDTYHNRPLPRGQIGRESCRERVFQCV